MEFNLALFAIFLVYVVLVEFRLSCLEYEVHKHKVTDLVYRVDKLEKDREKNARC